MYIKINLLPQDIRPKKVLISFDYRVVLILLIIVASAGLVGYYLHISRDLSAHEADLRTWKQKELMLQKTLNLQNEVIKLREDVSKRINVIKELTSDSDIRFSVLQHINTIIPENLWLLNMREISDMNKISINIEGMSYSKQDISAFLASFEECKEINSVSLESIKPAPLEIRDAYLFSIKVELKTLKPVLEEETAPTGSRRRRKR